MTNSKKHQTVPATAHLVQDATGPDPGLVLVAMLTASVAAGKIFSPCNVFLCQTAKKGLTRPPTGMLHYSQVGVDGGPRSNHCAECLCPISLFAGELGFVRLLFLGSHKGSNGRPVALPYTSRLCVCPIPYDS